MSINRTRVLSSSQPGRLPNLNDELSLRKFLALGFLFSIIPVLLLFQTTLLHPSTLYIGENQDPGQFMWYLGWFWHAVLNGQNPLQTSLLNFPIGLNLMRNTSIAAEAVIFGPLFYLFNPVAAYNAAFAIGVMFTGVTGMLLLRQLYFSRWLALGGGMLLELAPYSTAQSVDGHINLIFSSVFVLSSLAVIVRILHRSAEYSRARHPSLEHHTVQHPRLLGIVLGALLSALFYTSAEVFATYALIAVISLIVWFILSVRHAYLMVQSVPRPFILWSLFITLLAISPGLYAFFNMVQVPSLAKTIMPVGVFVTDLFSPFIPTSAFLFHIHLTSILTDHMSGDLSEKGGYFGVPTVFILYWSMRKLWTNQFYKGLTIVFLIIFVLSLGPSLHILGFNTFLPLPWSIMQHVPLMQDALPSRLMFYADLVAIIIFLGAVQTALQTTAPDKRKKTLRISLFAMLTILLSWLPRADFAKQAMPAVQPALMPQGQVYKRIDNQPTTLITSSYFTGAYFMGLAAQLKFAVPFTNAYGFPYTSEFLSPLAPQLLKTNSIYTSAYAHQDEKQAIAALKAFVAKRHPHYILDAQPYSPALPKPLSQALDVLYGKPYTSGGVRLWNTSH